MYNWEIRVSQSEARLRLFGHVGQWVWDRRMLQMQQPGRRQRKVKGEILYMDVVREDMDIAASRTDKAEDRFRLEANVATAERKDSF